MTGTDLATTDPIQHIVKDQLAAKQLEVRPPSLADLDRTARLGLWLAAAESDSNDPKARGMAAALRMAYANSLGLPAHAASEIHLIRGNLTLSAKLCRALAHQHGLRVIKVEETPDSVTAAVITNDNVELGRTRYTLADAKKAGLSGNNWAKHADRMLWARASKRVLDDYAPWVTVGVLSEEQAEEITGQPMPEPDEVLVGEVVDDTQQIPFGEDL